MDIHKHFSAKYRKEFVNSALEVLPDSGVCRMLNVVEKLSTRALDVETKMKMLTAAGQEHNITWDSRAFEEQLKKPHDDLQKGQNAFASASKMMPVESSSMKSSPAPIQTNERVHMPQNDTACSSTTFHAYSEMNSRTGTSAPFTSQSGSRVSESRSRGWEVNNSYPRDENPLNQPSWKNMEFQDATSAAQTAAASAERASMAARAAAELASRGNTCRQNSSESNESPTSSKKYERPEKLRAFLGGHVADQSDSKGNDEIKSSGMKNEVQHLHQAERPRGSSRRGTERTSKDYSAGMRPPSLSSLISNQGFVNDEIVTTNLHNDNLKDYSNVQRISSESEVVESNRLNMKYGNVDCSQVNINVKSTKAASSNYVSDDERFWNSDINKHENDGGETSRMDAGEVPVRSNHEQSTSSDSFSVVFDDYNFDAEDGNLDFGEEKGNLLEPYNGGEPSSFLSNRGPFNVGQNKTGSFSKESGIQLHLFTESNPEEHSRQYQKINSLHNLLLMTQM